VLKWWIGGAVDFWNGGFLEWWIFGMVDFWSDGLMTAGVIDVQVFERRSTALSSCKDLP
jgi:hypothetical protein